jgi:hypothetical protein
VEWKRLIYFWAIWNKLCPFGLFYGHLVYCIGIWYSFSNVGMLYQDKSGNPAPLSMGRGQIIWIIVSSPQSDVHHQLQHYSSCLTKYLKKSSDFWREKNERWSGLPTVRRFRRHHQEQRPHQNGSGTEGPPRAWPQRGHASHQHREGELGKGSTSA